MASLKLATPVLQRNSEAQNTCKQCQIDGRGKKLLSAQQMYTVRVAVIFVKES